jgi:hypothetical protein
LNSPAPSATCRGGSVPNATRERHELEPDPCAAHQGPVHRFIRRCQGETGLELEHGEACQKHPRADVDQAVQAAVTRIGPDLISVLSPPRLAFHRG